MDVPSGMPGIFTLWVGAPACPKALAAKHKTPPKALTARSLPFIRTPNLTLPFFTDQAKTEVKMFVVFQKMLAQRDSRQPRPIVVK
jgi:hypothetical protein